MSSKNSESRTDDSDSSNPSDIHRMPMITLLLERASCRSFIDRPIAPETLDTILEAGIHAASGGNLQPFSIIKITREATKKALADLCLGQVYIRNAPVNLLFCIDWHRLRRWAELECAPFSADAGFRHFWISFQDTIIAAQTVCTAADALGLGSVYIGTIIEVLPQIRELCALPDHILPVVLLCLGYPTSRPEPRAKLRRDILVHDEQYNDPSDEALLQAFEAKYPNAVTEPTDANVALLKSVCEKVHDREYSERCLKRIAETGAINMAQRIFGMHYRADVMPAHNDEFLKIIRDFGFEWFQTWK